MRHDQYNVEAYASLLKYEFYSEGPKGKIKKQVIYKALEDSPYVFNLSFGDVDVNGEINDTIVSNNGDSQKVLATVAMTVFKFYEEHEDAYVFVTGSTKARTRLYRMGIANNLEEIKNHFHVLGLIGETWGAFEKGRDYEGFLIKRKDSNFVI